MSETNEGQPTPEAPKPTPPADVPNGDDANEPTQLPDDHPLVKALAAQKAEIKSLKEKASRLDQIEDASKTEAQRAAEATAAAEKRATEAEARARRREVAIEERLSAEDAALLDDLTDEDAMRRLAKRLAAAASRSSSTNYVPTEGTNPRPAKDERREFADFLTGR